MLTNVRRDSAFLPAETREWTEKNEAGYRDTLLKALEVRAPRRRRLRAVLGHAVSFWTWRSLCLENGMTNQQAVEAMSALVLHVAGRGVAGRDAAGRGVAGRDAAWRGAPTTI
jgi:hypothetical protein